MNLPIDLAVDRIAEIIMKFGPVDAYTAFRTADAIVRELSITTETAHRTTYPKTPIEDRRVVRYVTKWIDDDQSRWLKDGG